VNEEYPSPALRFRLGKLRFLRPIKSWSVIDDTQFAPELVASDVNLNRKFGTILFGIKNCVIASLR